MSEFHRALALYRDKHPEIAQGQITLDGLFGFLLHIIDELQEQLGKSEPQDPEKARLHSEASIARAFRWAGMKGQEAKTEPANDEPNQ